MLLNVLNRPLLSQRNIPLLRVAHCTMCELARVFVRSVEHEERMQISFRYHPDDKVPATQQRVYTFDRLKTELVERTIGRIATKINSVVAKRLKKRNKSLGINVTPAEVRVAIREDGITISDSELNETAWTQGKCMHIDDRLFHVCVNVPAVRKLSLPQLMMVGFPIYANINFEFVDVSDCEFTWYRLVDGVTTTSSKECDNLSTDEEQDSNTVKKCKKHKQQGSTAVKIFTGHSYVPTVEDVGYQLKLECVPARGEVIGDMVTDVSSAVVQNGPTIVCPYEKRHKLTEQLTSGDWFVFCLLGSHTSFKVLESTGIFL